MFVPAGSTPHCCLDRAHKGAAASHLWSCAMFSSDCVEDDDSDDGDSNNSKDSNNKCSRRYVSTFVLSSGTGIPGVTLMCVSNKLV